MWRWLAVAVEALPLRHLVIVVTITAVVLVGLSFARIAAADYQIHLEKSNLERQVGALAQENHRLQTQIEYLKTDAAVETLPRDELSWTRPGDTAIVVVRDSPTAGAIQPWRAVADGYL